MTLNGKTRMPVVYTACTVTDAYIVKGLLENNGIAAFVSGDYLQGAIGGLPASGMITVSVEAGDAASASRVIAEFEGVEPDS